MTLKRILIGLSIVLVLLIAIVVGIGLLTPNEKSGTRSMTMSVGDRTLIVGGQYKEMTQESLADGIKITVDGHEITLGADQLEVDGKTQVLEPGQDVQVTVDDKGAVSVKVVSSDAGGTTHAAQ